MAAEAVSDASTIGDDGMDIVLWNQSARLKDSDGQLIADACDLQMREDYAPAYGLPPPPPHTVSFVPFAAQLEDLPKDRLVIIFAEDTPAAARLAGFMTAGPTTLDPPALPTTRGWDDSGRNFARVYPGTILDSGGRVSDSARSISAATSHECIEATYDRDLTKWVWNERDKVLVACEVCDQVEADAYPKIVQEREVAVSNFVYPAWFDVRAHDCQFDQMGELKEPFTCSKDGYLILYDPANPQDKVHTEPPEAALPAGWNAKNKSDGFARTRVRLVW